MKSSLRLSLLAATALITLGISSPSFACYRQRSSCYYNCMRFHDWKWYQKLACALGGKETNRSLAVRQRMKESNGVLAMR